MVDRLVLGCGALGRVIVDSFTRRSAEFLVIDDDEDRVEALRLEKIPAQHDDPTSRSAIASAGEADLVVVAGDESPANRAAAEAARSVHPEATLIVYGGEAPSAADREAMADLADRFLDRGTAVARRLVDLLGGDSGGSFVRFKRVLRRIDGPLGVFTHDNPDPDAIASAIALRNLARTAGLEAEACYFGDISHQENRAFVNLLELDLRDVGEDGFDPAAFGSIALVDHSRPGVNDQLPPATTVDIVLDHHPPRASIAAEFIDLRTDAGATSTLLGDYYRQLGLPVEETVATALLYGIRVDTRDFDRGASELDFEVAAFLLEFADTDVLHRVESPSITGNTLETIARAITNRVQRGNLLISGVGAINDRDTLAQAAEQLLTMGGVTTTVVFGFTEGVVYVSARTRGSDLDIGEALRQAFDQIGSAGGHDDMAGAQLPMGIIGTVDADDEVSLESVVNEVITNRFFEVIDEPWVANPPPLDTPTVPLGDADSAGTSAVDGAARPSGSDADPDETDE